VPDWCTCGAEQRVDKWWELSGALAVHSTSITAITPTVLIPSISVYTYCSALPLTHTSHCHSCRFDSIYLGVYLLFRSASIIHFSFLSLARDAIAL
jgi:hypothetical protein